MGINHGTKEIPGSDELNITTALGFALGVIALLLLVIAALVLGNLLPPARKIPDQPAFERAADQAVFRRLLAKHGLQYDVSAIYEDHLGRYFIRGGKRCAFR